MLSLNARLLIAASVVLVAFLGLTGFALDRAFRDGAMAATRDRLQAQVYALLSAADVDDSEQLRLPEALPEPRFSTPASGLYAQVMNGEGQTVWRSPSTIGIAIDFPAAREPGSMQFEQSKSADGVALFTTVFAVTWETGQGRERHFVFQVAESHQNFDNQVGGFRRSLWGWLAAATMVLLAVQGSILRWSLGPLRRVAREVNEIEAGIRTTLAGEYPKELRLLTASLNALITSSHAHLERYRNALGDLAHSLKTPLAVLRGAVESGGPTPELRQSVQDQVERMDQTVQYQLQRAAASGRTALTAPIPVEPIVRKILDSLHKVYAEKSLEPIVEITAQTTFSGDEGDLMEILGNLADNAWKWARCRLAIRAHNTDGALVMEVEDDGPGIPVEHVAAILKRGVRADPSTAGHGIGLAVVTELVETVYGGRLQIDSGALGGTRTQVTIPG